jgi:hypothetical protein
LHVENLDIAMSSNFNLLGSNSQVSVSHCNRLSCRLVKRGIASPRGREASECGFDEVEPCTSGHAELGEIVSGRFTPVLAKHSKSLSLSDCIPVGVDRMQRKFEPMRRQVEAWQKSELTDVSAKVAVYEAFVECQLEAPKHLAGTVHDLYFEPT